MRKRDKSKQAKYAKTHYEANKPAIKERAKAFSAKHLSVLRGVVRKSKNRPCHDCGKRFPYYVMDFDHVSGVKSGNVSDIVNNKISVTSLLCEIGKCDVVCANCHRIRTWNRRVTGKPEQ